MKPIRARIWAVPIDHSVIGPTSYRWWFMVPAGINRTVRGVTLTWPEAMAAVATYLAASKP